MKAVILAGGKGTRLSEPGSSLPKPMVEIGGMPILWHIMKGYAAHGVDEFVICLGHKGSAIKDWFLNYRARTSDLELNLATGETTFLGSRAEPWKVILADTGEDSLTGTRLARIRRHLTPGEAFCMTYGDGVGDVDIAALIAEHKAGALSDGRVATVTATQPEGRFGSLELDGDKALAFVEKPKAGGSWINAGFFVLEPEALDYIPDMDCLWEEEPIRAIAGAGKLRARKHAGFWRPMDTPRDRTKLEALWASGRAPWKVWSDQ